MEIGDKARVSPKLTNEKDWIEGEVIDIEQNPFKGIVIAIRDESGCIIFGEEKYFLPVSSHEPNEATLEALREAKERNYTGSKRVDTSNVEAMLKSSDDNL
jgi:hypothetical protein